MNTEKYLKGTISFLEKYGKTSKEKADVEILKQWLEERQALEIIVKKNVDISKIKHFIRMELPSYYNLDYYNEHLWKRKKQKKLTQEEYDLVSKVVKEIENEK